MERKAAVRREIGLWDAKKQENFLKLGVDFAVQTRYNVCLYGKLEEGGAIHAQH